MKEAQRPPLPEEEAMVIESAHVLLDLTTAQQAPLRHP